MNLDVVPQIHESTGNLPQADLGAKLIKGRILSKDFLDKKCNCNATSKINGKQKKKKIVYKATCRICDMIYTGNTQQNLKDKMNQHAQDVRGVHVH